jgi:hypothetical protein
MTTGFGGAKEIVLERKAVSCGPFVSQALLGGASEGEVKDWVGHRDTRMVELYRHLCEQDSKLKMQRINFLGDQADSSCSGSGKSVDNSISLNNQRSEAPAASGRKR